MISGYQDITSWDKTHTNPHTSTHAHTHTQALIPEQGNTK